MTNMLKKCFCSWSEFQLSEMTCYKIHTFKMEVMAARCQLETMTSEDILILHLIDGVFDPKLREKLLQQKDPTLTNLVATAVSWETASEVQYCLISPTHILNKVGIL